MARPDDRFATVRHALGGTWLRELCLDVGALSGKGRAPGFGLVGFTNGRREP